MSEIRVKFVDQFLEPAHHDLRLQRTSRDAAQRREEDRGRRIQGFECPVDSSLDVFLAGRIPDHHAGERPDFHRHAVIARRLEPRVLGFNVELSVGRFRSRCTLASFRLATDEFRWAANRTRSGLPIP